MHMTVWALAFAIGITVFAPVENILGGIPFIGFSHCARGRAISVISGLGLTMNR